MPYGVDLERILGFVSEADTIVADPKAQLTGVSPQLLDIPFTGRREPVESGEDTHGCSAVDPAEVSARGGSPNDPLHGG
jgi:hypothetical protein